MPVCKMCGYTASSAQTVCRICGKALDPTPSLIEEAGTPALATAAAGKPRMSGGRRALIIAAPTVVAAGVLGTFLFQHSVPRLEQIVPRDAVGVLAVDGEWWWNTSADVRAQPQIKQALADAEDKAGISLSQDVAPWVGEIGVSVLRADAKKPQILACAQVRDWPAFFRTAARLKEKATDETGGKWTKRNYNGVEVERLQTKDGSDDPAMELCWVNGWVLVGLGDGTVERAIDTVQGRSESLNQDATWMQALSHRPEHWFAWGGADWAQVVPSVKTAISEFIPTSVDAKTMASLDTSMKSMKNLDCVTLGVASDSGNGLRFDTITIPRNEAAKAVLRDLHGTSGAIGGDILKQLPKDSMMAFVGHDPNGWWHRYKKSVLSQMPKETHQVLDPVLAKVTPLESSLANFHGDSGLALTFQGKAGFGAIAMAQADDAASAEKAASALALYLKDNKVSLKDSGKYYSLPELTSAALDPSNSMGKFLQLAPCFGTRDGYLVAASTPELLSGSTTSGSALTLPDAARNADAAAFGDFRLVPEILKATDATAALPTVNKLGLTSAHWDMYVVSAPDGSLQQTTAEIQGWDWRNALRASMKLIP